jgi:four helix bundle protein
MEARARTFRDLLVWQKSHALALNIYRATARFPKSEQYGLVAQMQRAAVSVPANIAEGFGRSSKLEKRRFLNIAQGSLEELRYYVILAHDLGYPVPPSLSIDVDEVARMLEAYRRRISLAAS